AVAADPRLLGAVGREPPDRLPLAADLERRPRRLCPRVRGAVRARRLVLGEAPRSAETARHGLRDLERAEQRTVVLEAEAGRRALRRHVPQGAYGDPLGRLERDGRRGRARGARGVRREDVRRASGPARERRRDRLARLRATGPGAREGGARAAPDARAGG